MEIGDGHQTTETRVNTRSTRLRRERSAGRGGVGWGDALLGLRLGQPLESGRSPHRRPSNFHSSRAIAGDDGRDAVRERRPPSTTATPPAPAPRDACLLYPGLHSPRVTRLHQIRRPTLSVAGPRREGSQFETIHREQHQFPGCNTSQSVSLKPSTLPSALLVIN